jgi:radical SAM superfamily enzyme YgiQ (UPF0313 family)
MNNILVMNSPYVPSYFNAGHHLPIFEVGQYLRSKCKNTSVTCIDAGALTYTWKEIGDYLYQNQYQMIAIMLDFDSADNFERLLHYIEELSPASKLVVYGRLCKQIPDFFKKYDIDGIVTDGDFESSVYHFWKYVCDNTYKPKGCAIRSGDSWFSCPKGLYLDASNWVFPDLSEIPYDYYSKLYLNDSNKFCGIPNKKELVVHVSRGCPVNCKYCDVSSMQGTTDRRFSPETVYQYITQNFKKYQFEYVSMYSAIFTLNHKWTTSLCNLMMDSKTVIPWKCVTTIEHLSTDLIECMAKAHCVRISIGIENLYENNGTTFLPAIKKDTIKKFESIALACNRCAIELNCFVMLGIPGITLEDSLNTIQTLNQYQVRIRPTVYTPYYKMNADMSLKDLAKFNRQLFDDSMADKERLYNILFGKTLKNTEVFKHIG